MGRLGIERYNQPLANGYAMATPGRARSPRRPSSAGPAVSRRGRPSVRWEVYRRGSYFRSRIENDILRKILVTERHAEQIMANWEPFMYNGQGCFCDRCKESSALQQVSGRRRWIASGRSCCCRARDAWRKFRSWQHGKLMATLEETVNALGKEAGLDSHFIPEIHYGLLTASWRSRKRTGSTRPWTTWASCPCWSRGGRTTGTSSPPPLRLRSRAAPAGAHHGVRRAAVRRRPAAGGKTPPAAGFPYGTYEGATQRRRWPSRFLTYFLNGYGGPSRIFFRRIRRPILAGAG